MAGKAKKFLTYVLSNGDERTVALDPEKLFDLVRWYHDTNSNNSYELSEEKDKPLTLFKNTILSVRYQ